MAKTDITAERLRELLHYDPETGLFTRRKSWGTRKEGAQMGRINQLGYVVIAACNAKFLAHRLAWLYVHAEWPKADIDHIDGNRANNRIANLRDVSRSVNL